MHTVLIWCNVGSCRRVSGVMGVAVVVCDGGRCGCVPHEDICCNGGRCVCVLRASGVMG